MSTTTWPRPRATSRTCSTAPARTSTHRSGRGSPVITPRCGWTPRWTPAKRSASSPEAASRAAASSPDTSSMIPSCWASAPPYGSASTSAVRSPRRASSAATPAATVVRPGAPAGPHTAITRPSGPSSPAGSVGVPVGSPVGRPGPVAGSPVAASSSAARTAPGRSSRASSATRTVTPTRAARSRAASGSEPLGSTATGRTWWRRRWSVAARSRPGESSPSTATSAWPTLAAASRSSTSTQRLRTTIPAASVSSRRAAGSHAAPEATTSTTTTAQPRRTTVRTGLSSRAEEAEEAVRLLLLDGQHELALAGRGEALGQRRRLHHGDRRRAPVGPPGPGRRRSPPARPGRRPPPIPSPTEPGTCSASTATGSCTVVVAPPAAHRRPRQQLARADAAGQLEVGRQLVVDGEVVAEPVRLGEAHPGGDEVVRDQGVAGPEVVRDRPDRDRVVRRAQQPRAGDHRDGHDQQADPQPWVAPAGRRGAHGRDRRPARRAALAGSPVAPAHVLIMQPDAAPVTPSSTGPPPQRPGRLPAPGARGGNMGACPARPAS